MNPVMLARKNIARLEPYSCARNEFQGKASVLLDANENPYNYPNNRYPDPLQCTLKKRVSQINNLPEQQIFIGNGSDECIDLTFRIFCEPGNDNAVAISPTYGMYKVCADINNIDYLTCELEENFNLNAEKLLAKINLRTKIILLCSPNNPTANLLNKKEIRKILDNFNNGLVAIDEAYIDFTETNGWLPELDNYPNLIIFRTFSKAWGLAAMRCGMTFASKEIIALFNKVKYPYNVSSLTQNAVLEQLNDSDKQKKQWVKQILNERNTLVSSLKPLKIIQKIYHSDANFILVKVVDANSIYSYLTEKGIIVRNRSKIQLCDNCLRITVGTPEENHALINALKSCPL
ncbi:MAG: histidinol-phosphate transaminase [Dysgonamonadaceae bacterium]|jgi:histidinol-phosphate aminotransferase|nr:histidinol-phosphate transaminase [Dysgonamonadaceae bacterium]